MNKTQLSNNTALKAFSQYNLGEPTNTPQFIKGDVDINYKIITKDNTYLLKYIVEPSHIPQFKFLGKLHEYLRSKNVVVPKIYKTKNDKYVIESFILYQFV